MGYTARVRQFTMACNDDLPARPQRMTEEGHRVYPTDDRR